MTMSCIDAAPRFSIPNFARSPILRVSWFGGFLVGMMPRPQRARNALAVIADPCGTMDKARKEPAYKVVFAVSISPLAVRA